MRVALFATCVNDALLPATAVATVRLLERLGVAVDFPAGQTRCGLDRVEGVHGPRTLEVLPVEG
ncbi:heterodisulfide reductase-related iron-sulfur binding cluster [Kitasatospora sp. NPDC086801]|uniref:heterodisulfide reductase-related iron-sulfur binding cluster n=1 Tax=Kitasatospora sp. NPDC086801 TaxID=3364066 RepID=UPI0038207CB2